MIKTVLLALLLIGSPAFSQEKKDETFKKIHFYIGAGYNSTSGYTLNSKLESNGIPAISKNTPVFNFGFTRYDKRLFTDIEMSINPFKRNSNSDISTMGAGVNGTGRIQYNFINNNASIFSGGFNLGFTGNSFGIQPNNNQVDLNNININNSKYISLYNYQFFVGPSIGFAVKNKKGLLGRINASYEFAVWSGEWKSNIASVSNSVNENGQSRVTVGAVFYLFDILNSI